MRSLLLFAAVVGICSVATADEKYVTIKGQVTWKDAKAPAVALVDFKGHADTKACCAKGPLASTELEVDPKSLGVKNVVVWIRPDDKDRTKSFPLAKVKPDLAKPKSKEHVIDQPMCQFEPRMTVARAGDTLIVKNGAKIGHNVNYSSDIEKFNLNLPAGSEKKLDMALEAQRFPILVACNIHPWMTAQVRVFDHPYYALSDKDGKFEIKDVPVGTWRIVYAHERGYHKGSGILGSIVEVKADKATLELKSIDLELPTK